MNKSIRNQSIALAGVAQAVYLVQQIAKHGTADSDAMEASIGSVLKIDATDVEDVFGGLNGVRIGLQQLEKQMGGPPDIDPEQIKYAATLVFLERKLVKRPKFLDQIKTGIEVAAAEAEQLHSVLDDNILSKLASLYQNTISKLEPRIIINGEQAYLTDTDNTTKIRALLLAGIRSAFLWRQCGGNRWKFLLFRTKIFSQVQQLRKLCR